MNTITSGYTISADIPGGVRRLILINYGDLDTLTISNGECTDMTLKTSKSAYAYNVAQELTGVNEKSIGKTEAGSHAYEQSISTKIFGNSPTLVTEMDSLASGRTIVITQLNDGTFELYFHIDGAKASTERVVDNGYDGMNGYNVSWAHKQAEKAPKVNGTVINSLTIA